jgi:hypothetical protein
MKAALVLELGKSRLDLRPGAVNEHEVHAERREEVEVVREIEEAAVGDEIAAERDHENLAAECMDVRGDRLEPVDEAILARKALATRRLRRFSVAVRARQLLVSIRNGPLLPARAANAERREVFRSDCECRRVCLSGKA